MYRSTFNGKPTKLVDSYGLWTKMLLMCQQNIDRDGDQVLIEMFCQVSILSRLKVSIGGIDRHSPADAFGSRDPNLLQIKNFITRKNKFSHH